MRTIVLRIIVLVTLLTNTALNFSAIRPVQAQEVCDLPSRLTPNMPGRVRAVSTAGNNLRAKAGQAAEITGTLANETEFIVQSEPECVDGLNWYQVETLDGQTGWTAEGENGLYWLEPTPFCTEQQREANLHYHLDENSRPFFRNAISVTYNSARHSLLIASQPEGRDELVHPALQEYNWLNLDTQIITPTQYPDADIVTPELTDKLGITEYVFGDKSQLWESLHVSPKRDRILYFTHESSDQDTCIEGCDPVEGWIANADGSQARSLGVIASGEVGYLDWEWKGNGYIYLTMIYAGGLMGIEEIYEDGSYAGNNSFPLDYAYPSVSPDGSYITFTQMLGGGVDPRWKGQIIDHRSGNWYALPLTSFAIPAIWSQDGQTIYFIGLIDGKTVLATTTVADIKRANSLLNDLPIRDGFAQAATLPADLNLVDILLNDLPVVYNSY